MFLSVKLLSIFFSLSFFLNDNYVAPTELSREVRVRWLLLHYHKTGHDLTEALIQPFSEPLDLLSHPCRVRLHRRRKLEPEVPDLFSCDIHKLVGMDMIFNWSDKLQKERHEIRIVHFVRDPFDMIVSAFFYHSQDPPPSIEQWLEHHHFNPCKYDSHVFDSFVDFITVEWMGSGENGQNLRVLLKSVLELCVNLRDSTKNGATYHSMLRNTVISGDLNHSQSLSVQVNGASDVRAGLLLEACRSILAVNGGDILRMASNALNERKTSSVGQSKRFFLSEFPVKDTNKFSHSITSVYEFLMNDVDTYGNKISAQFFTNLNVTTAVNNVMTAMNKKVRNITNLNTSKHVTQSFVSLDQRDKMIEFLKNDDIVGPILLIVQDILAF